MRWTSPGRRKRYLQDEIRTAHHFDEIVGSSAALTRVLTQVEVVAPTDLTVLIQGETGTGKELIACAIHQRRHGTKRVAKAVLIGASALLSSKLVKGAALKIYPGAPHGLCSTHKDQVSADLFAFLKA